MSEKERTRRISIIGKFCVIPSYTENVLSAGFRSGSGFGVRYSPRYWDEGIVYIYLIGSKTEWQYQSSLALHPSSSSRQNPSGIHFSWPSHSALGQSGFRKGAVWGGSLVILGEIRTLFTCQEDWSRLLRQTGGHSSPISSGGSYQFQMVYQHEAGLRKYTFIPLPKNSCRRRN